MPDFPVKILVVDDLPEKHVVYRALLDEPGQEVVSAFCGEDALKALLEQEFAVILLDINMPGMDGFEAAAMIRARKATAHTPIIFITAFPDEVFALKGYALGAVDYILAPVAPNILRTKVGVFVQLYRLTQQVKAHAARQLAIARGEQARLTAVLENAADFVGRADAKGRLLYINAAGRHMLGLGDQDVLDGSSTLRCDWLLPPDAVSEARRSGVWLGESLFQSFAGESIPVSQVILAHRNDDAVESFSVIARDITERKRAEQIRARLVSIIESSDDAIVSKDTQGVITSWNHGAERLFGYSAEEAVGQSIMLIIPATYRDEELTILERIRRGESIEHYETVRRRKDGSLIDISLTVSPLRDDRGRVIGASKIARDVGERKRSEEAIRELAAERARLLDSERCARVEAERLGRLKDEFLATLSHELRTPLNAILGWAKLLQGPDTTAEDVAEGLEVIGRNALAQAQLVDELLDMNRIVSGKLQLNPSVVDVGSIVADAVETTRLPAANKEIQICFTAPSKPVVTFADGGRIRQIVWNLLSNAVKFTPKGGGVSVDVAEDDEFVLLSVTDTGEGIPAEFMPFLFDRFRQADASCARRHGGLGLGLAIVKQLVELHGGTVSAHSEGPHKGATFAVRLPYRTERPVGPAEAVRPPQTEPADSVYTFDERRLAGIRVLVVDDEPDSVHLARRVLEDCAADVAVAYSAAEAFDHVREAWPHVVVSDIGMPKEDGYSLIQRIRREQNGGARRQFAAIALTAFARPEDRQRALDAGYQAHLTKPVDPRELVRLVATVADRITTLPDAVSDEELPGMTSDQRRPATDSADAYESDSAVRARVENLTVASQEDNP